MQFCEIKDKEFKKVLMLLSPDLFLARMIEIGLLEKATKNYGEDIYSLCQNACAWAITQLRGTYYLYEFKVICGDFMGESHFWLRVGDYNIDLTLAQFTEAPRLAITKAKEKNGYREASIYEVDEYIESLKKEVNGYGFGCEQVEAEYNLKLSTANNT